jgi:hypothetical protein
MVEWIDGRIVWTPADQLVVDDSKPADNQFNEMRMISTDAEQPPARRYDKQLRGISLQTALEKRRLDQALNAKEFAICAGISYSTARSWFRLPGFPVFHGVVFWGDFVQWRAIQTGVSKCAPSQNASDTIAEQVRILEEGGRLGAYPTRRFIRRKGRVRKRPA